MAAILSLPPAHRSLLPPPHHLLPSRSHHPFFQIQTKKKSSTLSFSLSSPLQISNSIVTKEEEEEEEEEEAEDDGVSPPEAESSVLSLDDPQFRGCKACGRQEIEKGCNGEGRIQGGMATVPGFGWWPIKAFRPCPGFLASGGRYRRRGQSMDEVAFGRGKRDIKMESTDKVKSSKKKQGPERLKG
ncbi:uncharacterized protein LOC109715949 [Ananas comosus]|uniref:Uncharacterized protein LOC109715949 n=1 Tax=Ananas comosus TaxID=4615 RepID=A0A6P5FTB9_ANACO|nr:uncharacterized protein LOC109715949 [Ananas comosus]